MNIRAAASDGVPSDCVVNFDTIHTLPREAFRRPVATFDPARLEAACQTLKAATGGYQPLGPYVAAGDTGSWHRKRIVRLNDVQWRYGCQDRAMVDTSHPG